MKLNLIDGDFRPHIRWMASTASWRISSDDGPQPLTWQHAIFDLAGVQTGWGIFAEGQAPEWVWDPSLTEKAERPNDGREWRRGFKLNVFSRSSFGGLREFATTATGACMGIQELYQAYEAEAPKHPGRVPVVRFDGATHTKIGKGSTSVPTLKIVEWRDRPAELQAPAKAQAPRPLAQYEDHQAPLGNEAAAAATDPNDQIPINL